VADVTVSGFDSVTRGTKTVRISFGAACVEYEVTVLKPETGSPQGITVTFSLFGAPPHDSKNDGITYTLRKNNLQTWIASKSYTIGINDTVKDLLVTALTQAGLTWKADESGNYIESITRQGVTLAEFTNGPKSGWMFTLNGEHRLLGISEQYLEDGDVIVFHYTDDYTAEQGSEQWSGSGGSSDNTGNTTVTPTATVNGGTASASVTLDELKTAIGNAKGNGNAIVVAPEFKGTVNSMKVELGKDVLSTIGQQTSSDLIIQTPVGSMTLPNSVVSSIASQASGSKVTVSVETVEKSTLTADQRAAVGGKAVYDISVLSGSAHISSFNGNSITISLPYSLKNGEDASGVTVWYLDDSGSLQQMTASYDKLTGLAAFTTTHLSYYVVGYAAAWQNPFGDVKSTDWFYDAVKYVSQSSLMSGTSSTAFEPNADMTRAMLVTVLYRMEGRPAVAGTGSFTDVQSGQWYSDAVSWAGANKIVSGYGSGLFGTNDSLTREQLTAILMNYAKFKAYDVTKTTPLTSYTDASSVDSWAHEAMEWAVAEGYLTGTTTTTLSPVSAATRAQVATILMRFAENAAA
jgi:hypothetical protein